MTKREKAKESSPYDLGEVWLHQEKRRRIRPKAAADVNPYDLSEGATQRLRREIAIRGNGGRR